MLPPLKKGGQGGFQTSVVPEDPTLSGAHPSLVVGIDWQRLHQVTLDAGKPVHRVFSKSFTYSP
jgi:hypothetical protein